MGAVFLSSAYIYPPHAGFFACISLPLITVFSLRLPGEKGVSSGVSADLLSLSPRRDVARHFRLSEPFTLNVLPASMSKRINLPVSAPAPNPSRFCHHRGSHGSSFAPAGDRRHQPGLQAARCADQGTYSVWRGDSRTAAYRVGRPRQRRVL